MAVYFHDRKPSIWQQAAVNLIGGLVTDAIQKGRETAQNRKMNALMAQSMQDAQGGNNLNVDFTGGLASVPEGYNNNGWQQSFHKTGSPVEQFNIGTAQITQPKQNFIPSAWDIRQAILNNAKTDRFSSVNPELIEKIANPYYQNAEQMRFEGLRNQAADEVMNAQNSTDRRNLILSGIVRGLMPDSLANVAQNAYEHDNPSAKDLLELQNNREQRSLDWDKHKIPSAADLLVNKLGYAQLAQDLYKYQNPHLLPSIIDIGGNLNVGAFNPATGERTQIGELLKTLSPSDNVAKEHNNALLDFYKQELELKAQQFANTRDYRGSLLDLQQKQYNLASLESQRKALQDEYKALSERASNIISELNGLKENGDTLQKAMLLREATNIQQRMSKIMQLYNGLYTSFMPQQTAQSNADTDYDNLGSMFLGENSVITSPFGSRVLNGQQGNHNGQDNRAKEGTPLKVPSALGDDFRVTRVYSGAKNGDPKGGNGYGNHIELEGTIKGTPVRFLFAHLQPGSVNLNVNDTVKAGQVFAKTGNTGRSTAPHLHTEVMIKNEKGEWKNVDPDKFFKQYKGNFGATSPIAPNTGLADIKPDSNDVKNTPKVIPDNAVFARKDGDTLTQEDINELLSKGHTLDEIKQYGYTVTDNAIKKVRDNPVNKRMSRGYPHFIGGL